MSVTKFLTPEKLLDYLGHEVGDALMRHGVRSVFNYAWADEDTPSDEFIGLAKWSLDGFQHQDHDQTAGDYYSKSEHEHICVISTDLEALLDMSALSIGQTLWLADQVKEDVLGKNQFFWLNYINSLTLLGMASDRVRDLFLSIYFRTSLANYLEERKGKNLEGGQLKPGYYRYPFAHALSDTTQDEIKTQLDALNVLAGKIYTYRERRNDTVHEIATHEARLTKQYFADGNRRQRNDQSVISATEFREHQKNMTKKHEQTVDDVVQTSTDWYMKLVLATSHIFDIEYELRIKSRSGAA